MKIQNNEGFTLLELLVVVLIIGILAAIALPQYRKAVEKAKSAEALSLLSSIVSAQQRYFLVHDKYSLTFNGLDIDFRDYEGFPVTDEYWFSTNNFVIRLNGEDYNTAYVEAVKRSGYRYALRKMYSTGRIQCGDAGDGSGDIMCPLLGFTYHEEDNQEQDDD